MKILNFFKKFFPEDKIIFEKSAKDFENLAIGILNVFEEHTRKHVNDVLLIRYYDFIKMNCLQLAFEAECDDFIAHNVTQQAVEKLWNGNEYDEKELVSSFYLFIYN